MREPNRYMFEFCRCEFSLKNDFPVDFTSKTSKYCPFMEQMMYKNLKKIESESLFNGEVANKISIQQMDMVLQRQLYGICYPVVRKRLWQSSKLLSSFGAKPKTLLAKNAIFRDRIVLIPEFQNCVILLSKGAWMENFSETDLMTFFRFFIVMNRFSFQHSELRMKTKMLENILKHCYFISHLCINAWMPNNWEQILYNSNCPSLWLCKFYSNGATDFAFLKRLIVEKKPVMNIRLTKRDEYNETGLEKYFVPQNGGVFDFGGGFIPRLDWHETWALSKSLCTGRVITYLINVFLVSLIIIISFNLIYSFSGIAQFKVSAWFETFLFIFGAALFYSCFPYWLHNCPLEEMGIFVFVARIMAITGYFCILDFESRNFKHKV